MVLGGNITMRPIFLHPPKKAFLPLHFGQEENIPGDSIEGELTDLFWKLPGCSLFVQVSRNTMINTLRASLEDKSMLIHCQKGLLSPFSLSKNRTYSGTPLKQELTDLFWKLPRILYSLFSNIQHRQSRQKMVNTLLVVNINPIH